MSSIILKKSSVAGKIPLSSDLQYGEIALNYTDGVIYYKKADNTIGTIGMGSSGSGSSGTSAVRRIYETALSAGQTTITIPDGYTVGLIDFVFNGSQLYSQDYTANDGSTVVLAVPAVATDVARFTIYDPVGISSAGSGGFEQSFLLMGA